jgi:hypothetical protein
MTGGTPFTHARALKVPPSPILYDKAARERYLGTLAGRREAMQAFVGIRKVR